MEFTIVIQSSVTVEVSEMLKSTMQVNREQGSSEAVASQDVTAEGNVSNTTLSNTIDLDPPSPTHNTANLDDIPLNIVYKNQEKALPPSPSTKPQLESDNFKDKESDVFFVKPIQALHLDGDTVVCPPYLDVDARIEIVAKEKERVFSRLAKTQAYETVIQSQTSDSPVLDKLSEHLDGELPDYEPNSKIAYETALDFVVLENQQQPETLPQMASKTHTEMIIHPDFRPDSPLQTILETSSTDQLVSDASALVSEDQTHVVQPINVAQPENSLQTALDTLVSKTSVLKPILEPVPKPTLDTSGTIIL